MVKYTLKSGNKGSRCELVAKEISVAYFILDFKINIFYLSMQCMVIGLSGWIKFLECVRRLFPLALLYPLLNS